MMQDLRKYSYNHILKAYKAANESDVEKSTCYLRTYKRVIFYKAFVINPL